jgi:aryl-alcohol dehydrogenase-like predicted oxidoreductase
MERRALGKTGQELSIVGFGGIVVMNVEPPKASRLVSEAVDRGVNYFDVAPSYGNAEERLGPALAPYRDRAFLACKTGKRGKEEAAQELRQSLARMQTDHFDLYQLHALTSMEEMEQALGPGGALEAFLEARDAGLIRYIGFSAHSVETALAAMDRFDCSLPSGKLWPSGRRASAGEGCRPPRPERHGPHSMGGGPAAELLEDLVSADCRPRRSRSRTPLHPLAADHRRDSSG